ncbi:MAG: MarR family transcriptional regulator [Prolixibacteraceae bacterium]|nr:MarR family transcriptional regulator [Prolixibacteraceae bacterium]
MDNLKTAIAYLSDLCEKVFSEVISQNSYEDLTNQQLNCMLVIIRLRNPTLTQLSKELNLTKPTVTVLVDKLVNKGYLRRVTSENDRRAIHLHIEKKGENIERLRGIAHLRMTERIMAGLNNTEALILTELLKKVLDKK